jgi:hypothetical protein
MKTRTASAAALIAGLTLLHLPRVLGQGTLTPPGPPAATMKSLDQVEARTIVNATNTPGDGANTFIIRASGSYYLTASFTGTSGKHGISIQADDVTLDLNGFALTGGGGGANRGIDVPAAQKNLCVRNGTVRGWTDGGVRAELASSTLAEKLRLVDNVGATGLEFGRGTARDCVATGNATGFFLSNGAEIRDCAAAANVTGFFAGDRTMISNCIATENTGRGFDCTSFVTIVDCTSSRNNGTGILVQGSSSVLRCNASRNIPSGHGIQAGAGCTVADCTAGSNGINGIQVDFGSTVRGCTAQANLAIGIVATASCHLTGNTCDSNQIGLEVTGDDNRVDGNSCTVNPAQNGTSGYQGFYIKGANNWVVRNTARGSFAGTIVDQGFVYDSYSNNAFGPIQRTSGGDISTMSPWANFRH